MVVFIDWVNKHTQTRGHDPVAFEMRNMTAHVCFISALGDRYQRLTYWRILEEGKMK